METAQHFKIIFCFVGESGSGKTMVAEAIEKYAGIIMIQSYTDRPRRTPDENGHTFITKEQFDALNQDDMIAFTEWNGYRYCCLHSDVRPINTYVIDERGLTYLKSNFSDKYKIIAIRFYRPLHERIEAVGKERIDRDEGKFNMAPDEFDLVIYNTGNKLDMICQTWGYIEQIHADLHIKMMNELILSAPKIKRTHCYVLKPAEYEINCPLCGGTNINWSEFEKHIWCYDCSKDVFLLSKNTGIFNGPIPINAAEMMSLKFDRINLENGQVVKRDSVNFNKTWVNDEKLSEFANYINNLTL